MRNRRPYSAFRTMPSDVGHPSCSGQKWLLKTTRGNQALGIVWYLQAVEEAKKLIARSIPTRPAIQRCRPGECLLLHRQGGLQIDLRRFNLFVPEPQGDHGSVDARLQ